MTTTSIIGTIKDFEIVEETHDVGAFCVLSIKEYDEWNIFIDDDFLPRCRPKLKKGNKYLFEGKLFLYETSMWVYKVLSRPSNAKLKQLYVEGSKNHVHMSIRGTISTENFMRIRDVKHKEEAIRAKFKDFPYCDVFFPPSTRNKIRKIYKKNKEITVLGALLEEKPQFNIEEIKELD